MTIGDNLRAGHEQSRAARAKRLIRFGWLWAGIYFLILANATYRFARNISSLREDHFLAALSVAYVLLAALYIVGCARKKPNWMIPMLVFQGVTFLYTFTVHTQAMNAAAMEANTSRMSHYYAGLLFGVLAFVVLQKRVQAPDPSAVEVREPQ